MDLMKAFDFSDYDILIVKLNAYGFSMLALKLIHDYLYSEKQRTKINSSYVAGMSLFWGTTRFNSTDFII